MRHKGGGEGRVSERVRSYFDGRAAGYREAFSRGLLGAVRKRERRLLFALLDPQAGDSVLDAGSGPGLDADRLRALGCRVKAVDLSPNMVREAQRAGIDAEVADLHGLALGTVFDKILCAGSLEFCASPSTVLARLADHLRPGGRLVVLFPLRSVVGVLYRSYHRLSGARARLFGASEIEAELERVGLRVRERERATPFSAVVAAEKPP